MSLASDLKFLLHLSEISLYIYKANDHTKKRQGRTDRVLHTALLVVLSYAILAPAKKKIFVSPERWYARSRKKKFKLLYLVTLKVLIVTLKKQGENHYVSLLCILYMVFMEPSRAYFML